MRFTLDSIGELAFGRNIDSQSRPSTFHSSFDLMQKTSMERLLVPWWKVHPLGNLGGVSKARAVLEAAGCDVDLSADALKFMSYVEGTLAGCPVRIFRISFSGELSYEIATPAGHGLDLWVALAVAGESHGIMPYGTEALHVMRAEKGFIMIGDETDGTVTPQDLDLGWAVSKKKADFIGKRAQERADLVRPGRKQLVGLRTENPADVLPDGAHAVKRVREHVAMETIGHVTSTYFSPTLGHSIAMALVNDGLSRDGEWLDFPVAKDKVMRAQIVSPVFYDPKGEKQNV